MKRLCNSKKMRVRLCLLLISAMLLPMLPLSPATEDVHAASQTLRTTAPTDPTYLKMDAEVSKTQKLDLWHYSGGYWKVTNANSDTIKVTDKVMGEGDDMVIPTEKATFKLTLPSEVKTAIAAGKDVVPVISVGKKKLSDYFQSDYTFSMDSTTLTFSATPKFNLIPKKTLSWENFDASPSVKVPFISRDFGYNMFSVFGNGYSAVQVNGYVAASASKVNPTDTSGVPRGWIHPSYIVDNTGKIKSGLELVINSKYMASDGFTVGKGTFSNAGALGLCFEYPVVFNFYVKSEHICTRCGDGLTSSTYCEEGTCVHWGTPECGCYVPPAPAPGVITCEACGKDELIDPDPTDGVDPTVCAPDTCPDYGTEDCGCYVPPDIDGVCDLILPPVTYVGHPVTAKDASTFTVDGESRSASYMYSENLATSRYRIVQSGAGTISKDTKTTAIAKFSQPGTFDVRLSVSLKGISGSLADTESIEVLKTPSVIAHLGGSQKQNRKQVLNISVATNPDNPLQELYVELRYPANGETVKLVHNLPDGTTNVLQNSDMIKTRPIQALPSDEYFTNCQLEFLTKNDENIELEYFIYAKDGTGNDTAIQSFTVVPDTAPVAKIEVDPTHVRESGTNTAVINAKDVSDTDGDQLERTWSVTWADNYTGTYDAYSEAANQFTDPHYISIPSLPGYQDNSFGTKQMIQFNRAGVGKIQLKLHVKDIWTDETLPEYITDADYRTAETTAQTEVINIAPMVSLEPIESKTANILLLGGNTASYNALKNSVSSISSALLSKAVDANITVEKMAPVSSNTITYAQRFTVSDSYGFQGSWQTFWEENSWAIDNYRLYKAEADWYLDDPAKETSANPHQPFVLRAYDAEGKSSTPLWSYTLTPEIMTVTYTKDAYFGQDAENMYLYWVIGGNTIILDKETGHQITILSSFKVGKYNTVANNNIYTFKSDGIYRISMSTGSITKIYSGTISADAARKLSGKEHFLVVKSGQLYRGVFDAEKEQVVLFRLLGNSDDSYSTQYTLHCVDANGRMMVIGADPVVEKQFVRIYEPNNALKKTFTEQLDGSDYMIYPILNAANEMHYIGILYESKSSSTGYYSVYGVCKGIDNSYEGSVRVRDSNGYPTMNTQLIYAVEHKDGCCYLVAGARRTYIANDGWANGSSHGYPERTVVYQFDIANNTAKQGTLGGGAFTGLSNFSEYGLRSDAYGTVSIGANDQTLDAASHKTTVTSWGQDMEEILSRYAQRHMDGSADYNVIVVYDSTNKTTLSAEKINELKSVLSQKNIHFLFAGASAYGSSIVNSYSKGAILPNNDSTIGTSISDYILSEDVANSGNNSLRIQTGASAGTFTKAYTLDPDTQYYYEYEVKGMAANTDPVTVSASYTKQIQNPGSSYYRVTDQQVEDFDDPEFNPFFQVDSSKIADGVYRIGWLDITRKKGAKNRFYVNESSFTFTVPSGKQAVLSFDYDVYGDGTYAIGNGVYIDDVWWQPSTTLGMVSGATMSGHYTHLTLLGPGTHTIRGVACDYGGRYITAHMLLDNLKVEYVEKVTAWNNSYLALNKASSLSADGNWKKVSGNVTTPFPTTSYSTMANMKYMSGSPSSLTEYVEASASAYSDKNIYSIHQPNPDYTLAFARLKTESRKWTDPVRFEVFDGITDSTKYRLHFYRCFEVYKDEDDPYTYYPHNCFIMLAPTANERNVTAEYSEYKKTTASVANMELGYIPTSEFSAPLSTNQYFVNGNIFGANHVYNNKVTFKFNIPANSDFELKNFKIYTIKNGVKVYVTDELVPSNSTGWVGSNVTTSIIESSNQEEEDAQQLVYNKGELVKFGINYFDYENDPSKKSYWRYTHTPFNDGAHPQAAFVLDEDGNLVSSTGTILNAPIERFYVDGKYTVEHWQEDNTTRGANAAGQPTYDKQSNVESITFYIVGGAGTAPWITSITTTPIPVKEGNAFKIKVGVDDAEKDILRLKTEVYYEGELIYTHNQTGITPNSTTLEYPITTTGTVETARAGTYDVVCTVRDATGVGIDTYRFTVVSEGKITGEVYHTDQWESNRKTYNQKKFGTEYNVESTYSSYVSQTAPRKRGTNVFWSGERFMLKAAVAGNPTSVTCQIVGTSYQTPMASTGTKNALGETIYGGSLWNETMINLWGRTTPKELTFLFTANYSGGTSKTHEVKVIVDTWENFYQLHRYL